MEEAEELRKRFKQMRLEDERIKNEKLKNASNNYLQNKGKKNRFNPKPKIKGGPKLLFSTDEQEAETIKNQQQTEEEDEDDKDDESVVQTHQERVESFKFTSNEHEILTKIGFVHAFVEGKIVIQSVNNLILNIGNTIILKDRQILGTIDDIIGRVKNPQYLIDLDLYTKKLKEKTKDQPKPALWVGQAVFAISSQMDILFQEHIDEMKSTPKNMCDADPFDKDSLIDSDEDDKSRLSAPVGRRFKKGMKKRRPKKKRGHFDLFEYEKFKRFQKKNQKRKPKHWPKKTNKRKVPEAGNKPDVRTPEITFYGTQSPSVVIATAPVMIPSPLNNFGGQPGGVLGTPQFSSPVIGVDVGMNYQAVMARGAIPPPQQTGFMSTGQGQGQIIGGGIQQPYRVQPHWASPNNSFKNVVSDQTYPQQMINTNNNGQGASSVPMQNINLNMVSPPQSNPASYGLFSGVQGIQGGAYVTQQGAGLDQTPPQNFQRMNWNLNSPVNNQTNTRDDDNSQPDPRWPEQSQ